MKQYMTQLEISTLWGVNPRTIQKLCLDGKLEGAIRHTSGWFIPSDAANPLENIKSDSYSFNFVGTKKKIFDSAIELFSKKGFENVSIRDIGDVCNINAASIYNHFSSKQEILNTMYDYYVENFGNNQRSAEEMKEILKNGTKEEFCAALMFTFETQDEEKQTRLFLITKIIYMRIYQDDKARDIFLNLMNSDIEAYLRDILEYGVSIGVLEEFDILTYAKFVNGQRHIMGIKAFANPHYEPRQLEEEGRIMKMSADMLPFITKE